MIKKLAANSNFGSQPTEKILYPFTFQAIVISDILKFILLSQTFILAFSNVMEGKQINPLNRSKAA